MKRLVEAGERIVYDFFDVDLKNPRRLRFETDVAIGGEFDHDWVTYRVEDVAEHHGRLVAILRVIRQRLRDTNTQVVHKCPAKHQRTSKLSRADILKLEEHWGKRRAAAIASPRVKLGIQLASTCPDCGCEFWKETAGRPESLSINKVMNQSEHRSHS